jgi:hypothetical protein
MMGTPVDKFFEEQTLPRFWFWFWSGSGCGSDSGLGLDLGLVLVLGLVLGTSHQNPIPPRPSRDYK